MLLLSVGSVWSKWLHKTGLPCWKVWCSVQQRDHSSHQRQKNLIQENIGEFVLHRAEFQVHKSLSWCWSPLSNHCLDKEKMEEIVACEKFLNCSVKSNRISWRRWLKGASNSTLVSGLLNCYWVHLTIGATELSRPQQSPFSLKSYVQEKNQWSSPCTIER